MTSIALGVFDPVYLCHPDHDLYREMGVLLPGEGLDGAVPVMLHSREPIHVGLAFDHDGRRWRVADLGRGWVCRPA